MNRTRMRRLLSLHRAEWLINEMRMVTTELRNVTRFAKDVELDETIIELERCSFRALSKLGEMIYRAEVAAEDAMVDDEKKEG